MKQKSVFRILFILAIIGSCFMGVSTILSIYRFITSDEGLPGLISASIVFLLSLLLIFVMNRILIAIK